MAFREGEGGGSGGWGGGQAGLGTLLALGRAAVGAALLLAPARLVGPVLRDEHRRGGNPRDGGPSDATLTALRMFAGRDLALGLGALAARHDPAAQRGWIWAGVLADATDAAAFTVTRALSPRARAAGLAVSAIATATGLGLARAQGPAGG